MIMIIKLIVNLIANGIWTHVIEKQSGYTPCFGHKYLVVRRFFRLDMLFLSLKNHRWGQKA
jgi:hypothetical protein